MALEGNNVVIYGAGRASARRSPGSPPSKEAGALAGRTRETLETVADETFTRENLATVDGRLEDAPAYQALLHSLDQMRMTHRSPRLAEVVAPAASLASEKAGATSGTFVNATSGTFQS